MKQYTYQQYLSRECDPEKYWLQYKYAVIKLIKARFTLSQLVEAYAQDKYLNTLSMDCFKQISKLAKPEIEKINDHINGKRSWSMSMGITSAKYVAIQIAKKGTK